MYICIQREAEPIQKFSIWFYWISEISVNNNEKDMEIKVGILVHSQLLKAQLPISDNNNSFILLTTYLSIHIVQHFYHI